MHRLTGILLEMQPFDADPDLLLGRDVDQHLALADDRKLELRDLIALRQVRIEIVLTVEDRASVDLGLEAEPRSDRLGDADVIDHRKHARHRGIDEGHLAVRLGAECGRGPGEQLRARRHLGVDLHADDDLPIAGRAFEELRCGCAGHGEWSYRIRASVASGVRQTTSQQAVQPAVRIVRSLRRGRTTCPPRKAAR